MGVPDQLRSSQATDSVWANQCFKGSTSGKFLRDHLTVSLLAPKVI